MDTELTHPLLAGRNIVLRQRLWRTPQLLQNGQLLVPRAQHSSQFPLITIPEYEIADEADGEPVVLRLKPDPFEYMPLLEINGQPHLSEPVALSLFEHRYAQVAPLAQMPFVLAIFGLQGGIIGALCSLLIFIVSWLLVLRLNFLELYKDQPPWAKYVMVFFLSLLANFVAVAVNHLSG